MAPKSHGDEEAVHVNVHDYRRRLVVGGFLHKIRTRPQIPTFRKVVGRVFVTEFVDVAFEVGAHGGDMMETGIVVEFAKEAGILGVQGHLVRRRLVWIRRLRLELQFGLGLALAGVEEVLAVVEELARGQGFRDPSRMADRLVTFQ